MSEQPITIPSVVTNAIKSGREPIAKTLNVTDELPVKVPQFVTDAVKSARQPIARSLARPGF